MISRFLCWDRPQGKNHYGSNDLNQIEVRWFGRSDGLPLPLRLLAAKCQWGAMYLRLGLPRHQVYRRGWRRLTLIGDNWGYMVNLACWLNTDTCDRILCCPSYHSLCRTMAGSRWTHSYDILRTWMSLVLVSCLCVRKEIEIGWENQEKTQKQNKIITYRSR